jgi:hypothetical protein
LRIRYKKKIHNNPRNSYRFKLIYMYTMTIMVIWRRFTRVLEKYYPILIYFFPTSCLVTDLPQASRISLYDSLLKSHCHIEGIKISTTVIYYFFSAFRCSNGLIQCIDLCQYTHNKWYNGMDYTGVFHEFQKHQNIYYLNLFHIDQMGHLY